MALPDLYDTLTPADVAELFNTDPDPIFVLDRKGRIVALNREAESLLDYHVLGRTANNRMVFGNSAMNAQVADALSRMTRPRDGARILKRHDGDSWLVLNFRALGTRNDVLVRLKVERQRELCRDDVAAAARALRLTEREAEVAFHVCQAMNAKEIARELNISPNTAKVHLRAVYAKCGCRGYADSLRTLLGLVGPA